MFYATYRQIYKQHNVV